MKKIILSVFISFCALSLMSQTAVLRLQAPEQQPQPGETFVIGLWLDQLNHDHPAIMSAQIFIEFDGEVITPVKQNGVYHINLHPSLAVLENNPVSNSPFPGDLRFVILATVVTGVEFGPESDFPVRLWDMEFAYHGGNTFVEWGTTNILEPVPGEEHGGTLVKGATMLSAPGNVMYELVLTGTSVGE
jgi:hypothetical protein